MKLNDFRFLRACAIIFVSSILLMAMLVQSSNAVPGWLIYTLWIIAIASGVLLYPVVLGLILAVLKVSYGLALYYIGRFLLRRQYRK